MEAARTERPAGWPGAPLARTGLLLLSTWVLAGAEITWDTAGGPGRLAALASRSPALPRLSPLAMASQWPEELATVRRGAALERRPGPEPLPQPSRGSGRKKQEAGGLSPASSRWGPGISTPGKPSGVRRSRRAQPPSALEHGDARASVLADGSKGSRPLAKGLREEVKAPRTGGSATEELRLPSTSFALTGDSAHNQAMVHWSGHNSSVILILTKLYDFNLGSVTESSLWRSTDYGTTYEKLNDKVGLKTVLSYLYVNPTNKRKIMLLSDPEIESSILISSDEGATYQKYRLTFYIQSLLFHPKQEDWVLAYSLDQKLYSSMDFGRRWQLMHERITPNRFYWSVAGLDKEADLVHMEVRTADGYAHYLTCRIQECAETTRSGPFARSIDISSLVVQDEYIFIQEPLTFEISVNFLCLTPGLSVRSRTIFSVKPSVYFQVGLECSFIRLTQSLRFNLGNASYGVSSLTPSVRSYADYLYTLLALILYLVWRRVHVLTQLLQFRETPDILPHLLLFHQQGDDTRDPLLVFSSAADKYDKRATESPENQRRKAAFQLGNPDGGGFFKEVAFD
ncbi:hypothetical protein JEQ12_011650, partial [Ovis aries]